VSGAGEFCLENNETTNAAPVAEMTFGDAVIHMRPEVCGKDSRRIDPPF
jgi:hypothetical protein